jgi:hypothetical protein
METSKVDTKLEREAIGKEFTHSMESRNHENDRRGGIRINQDEIMRGIEAGNLKGLDIEPPQVDEIVTDSESDDE